MDPICGRTSSFHDDFGSLPGGTKAWQPEHRCNAIVDPSTSFELLRSRVQEKLTTNNRIRMKYRFRVTNNGFEATNIHPNIIVETDKVKYDLSIKSMSAVVLFHVYITL